MEPLGANETERNRHLGGCVGRRAGDKDLVYIADEGCWSLPRYFVSEHAPLSVGVFPDPAMAARLLWVTTGETFRVKQNGVVAELIDAGGPAGPPFEQPMYFVLGLANCQAFREEGAEHFRQPTTRPPSKPSETNEAPAAVAQDEPPS